MQEGVTSSFDYQGLGKVILETSEIGYIGTIVFCIGASIFYYLLYSTKLVPRFLSIWGLLAVIPFISVSFLGMFGVMSPLSTTATIMDIPMALQEMVLAVWLIIKGFDANAVKKLSAKAE
jgi:hypothetical protein